MRILVTGGAGFIGSHIVEYHLTKGDEVVAIDNLTTGSQKNISPFEKNSNFKFFQADILNWPELSKYTAWADRIYHMAAVLGVYRVIAEPIDVLRTNILGCEYLLRSIVESKSRARILLASTSSVYGNSPNQKLNEEDNLIVSPTKRPLSGYAISKIADESLGTAYFQTYKLPITFIRFFNTIGPRQTGLYGMVVPRFVQQACRHEPITIYGDGKQTRSFCDVRDTVKAIDIIAEKNISIGEPINVGQDTEITIIELANIVRKHAKSSSEFKYIPYNEAYGKEFYDIQKRKPDLTKLYQLSHFKHQWTLEKTIDDLIEKYSALAPSLEKNPE